MAIHYTDQPGLKEYIQQNGQWISEINGQWYTSDDTKVESLIASFVPPGPPVPASITQRQARLQLLSMNLLDTTDSTIAGMTGDAGKAAQITWEFATTIDRDSTLISSVGAILNLTDAQIDTMFIEANKL